MPLRPLVHSCAQVEDTRVDRMIDISTSPGEPAEIWIENAKAVLNRYDGQGRGLLVDIGAHVGTVSLLALKEYGFEYAIAVEADLENFARMIDNIAINNCEGRILPIWAAITNTTLAPTQLYLPVPQEANSGCRSLMPYGTSFSEMTASLQLDDIFDIARRAGKRIDLLKIDIEGGEWGIIDNAFEPVDCIDLELHLIKPHTTVEAQFFLGKAGFRYSSTSLRLSDTTTTEGLHGKRLYLRN
jgi:FkbM family methyltransferase